MTSNVLRLWPEDEYLQYLKTKAEHTCSSSENKTYISKLMRS